MRGKAFGDKPVVNPLRGLRGIAGGGIVIPALYMKPFVTLGETRTPDGGRLILHEHDGDTFLKLNGRQLASSAATTSEIRLAEIACDIRPAILHPRVLIGGLGLGFTLRRVLEIVGGKSVVHVAECIPDVVTWNRKLLGPKNKAMFGDHRVTIITGDVFQVIAKSKREADRYDSIILDVDNGAAAMVANGNNRLYSRRGIDSLARALNPGGRAAIWSADEDLPFFDRLKRSGLHVTVFEVKSHERARRAAHRIYLAENRVE